MFWIVALQIPQLHIIAIITQREKRGDYYQPIQSRKVRSTLYSYYYPAKQTVDVITQSQLVF
jgi:hypothetical protein